MTTMTAGSGTPFLRGVRVFDVTGTLAGPYCTILSDLGAAVLKIEPRMRARRRPAPQVAPFHLVHRDKGSLAVDVKSAEADSASPGRCATRRTST